MNLLVRKLLKYYTLRQLSALTRRHKYKAATITVASIGAACLAHTALQRRKEFDLREKVILITGGSRGLGLIMAREFLRAGAKIAICARDVAELECAKADLAAPDNRILTIPCDITMPFEVEAMIQAIRTHYGRIDVLVNNAGLINVGPMEAMTHADFQDAMQTNYQAALATILAVLPEMRARQAGRIVNIASIGGKISVPHLLPYSVSKFALVGLSEGLRAELKKDGIFVTTVCPGLMRTGSPRNATFKGQHRAEYAWFSISDALPLLSMSAESAARRIVRACRYGEAEVILSLPAKLATKMHGLFPGLTADFLGMINNLLPAPGGIGTAHATGQESESAVSPSWLTTLNEQAAQDNNQIH